MTEKPKAPDFKERTKDIFKSLKYWSSGSGYAQCSSEGFEYLHQIIEEGFKQAYAEGKADAKNMSTEQTCSNNVLEKDENIDTLEPSAEWPSFRQAHLKAFEKSGDVFKLFYEYLTAIHTQILSKQQEKLREAIEALKIIANPDRRPYSLEQFRIISRQALAKLTRKDD